MIRIEPHPSLAARVIRTVFPGPLEQHPSPAWLRELLLPGARTPFTPLVPVESGESGEELRKAVRDMLRIGGYKPTGRGKPASEYLRKIATESELASINAAVDVCNAVSLHSGFPISVVDLGRAREPLSIQVARGAQSYVFNASGQTIDIEGLLCLFDAEGPCANAVKDSQCTKTHGDTTETLSIVWGVAGHEIALEMAAAWYRELLARAEARADELEIER